MNLKEFGKQFRHFRTSSQSDARVTASGRRRQRSLSQEQLGELIGVGKSTISAWENGQKMPQDYPACIAAIKEMATRGGIPNPQVANELLALLDWRALNEAEVEFCFPGYVPPLKTTTNTPPFQSPPRPVCFAGRTALVNELAARLRQGEWVTLQGMGGIGKTTLAAELAHQLRPYFSDGILWATLDQSDPKMILKNFALEYKEDVSHLEDVAALGSRVRSILAHKQVLIVLDNAQSIPQAEQLLPADHNVAVIVTTRRGLQASEQTTAIQIPTLKANDEAVLDIFGWFLTRQLGQTESQTYLQQQRHTLLEVAKLVEYLPLALHIAAARLAQEPSHTASHYLAQLRRQEDRLDALTDEYRAVRLTFDVSYQTLSVEDQYLFACLGAFWGDSFDMAAIMAITEQSPKQTQASLRNLVVLSLVERAPNGRYRLHHLLRDYALEKIESPQIFAKMIRYYAAYFRTRANDTDQLKQEAGNILAACRLAFERKLSHNLAPQTDSFLEQGLALTDLGLFVHTQAGYAEAEKLFMTALDFGQRSEDGRFLAETHSRLGSIIGYSRGGYAEAMPHLKQSLAIAREIDAQDLITKTLSSLGACTYEQGRWDEARTYLTEGLTIAKAANDTIGQVRTLQNLGVIEGYQGNFEQANTHLQEGLKIAQSLSHNEMQIMFLVTAGELATEQQAYDKANSYFEQGLQLAKKMDDSSYVSYVLTNLGYLAMEQGNNEMAKTHLQPGLALARDTAQPWDLATSLLRFGELALIQKELATAEALLQEAEAYTDQLAIPILQGAISFALARLKLAQGDKIAAEELGRKSLAIFKPLRHIYTAKIDAWFQASLNRLTD